MWMINTLKQLWVVDIEIGELVRFMCNHCKTETIHKLELVHSVLRTTSDYNPNDIWADEYPDEEGIMYRLFVCQGCGTPCLQVGGFDEQFDELINSEFWPSRIVKKRYTAQDDILTAKPFKSLSKKLSYVYQEAIKAYNQQMFVACAIIMRALLEGICVDHGITDQEAWGLEGKLDSLKQKGLLPENIVEGLHVFKFMGDDAAHRLEVTDAKHLKLAIEIIEDLLNRLYELNYKLLENTNKLKETRQPDYEKREQRQNKRK